MASPKGTSLDQAIGNPLKVSIVIPCYNGASTIADAVNSALAQTHPDVETIVVDDGSTDESLGLLRTFGDRIRLFTGPNRGGGAARNRGVEAATGEFVQFLDADDVLDPNKTEICVAAVSDLRENTIPVTDWRRSFADRAKPIEYCTFPCDRHDPLVASLDFVLQTSAPLHRRSELRALGGFREDLTSCQDKDLHLRLAAAGYRFHRLPIDAFTVRQTEGSVSSNNEQVLIQLYAVYEHLAQLLSADPSRSDWRGPVARALVRAGFDLCGLGKPDAGRPFFHLATMIDPNGKGHGGATGRIPRLLSAILGTRNGSRLYVRMKEAQRSFFDRP